MDRVPEKEGRVKKREVDFNALMIGALGTIQLGFLRFLGLVLCIAVAGLLLGAAMAFFEDGK